MENEIMEVEETNETLELIKETAGKAVITAVVGVVVTAAVTSLMYKGGNWFQTRREARANEPKK